MGLLARPDLGYYSVGEHLFFEKFEAFEYAISSGKVLRFHWNDEVWSAQDWSKVTATPLPEMYRRRAMQLREKYDYIVLSYSGGADSWNVLKTFDKFNIPLEEIVTYHDYSITGDTLSNVNAEVFKVALPTAADFVKRHPHTTHTLQDYSEALFEVLGKFSVEELLRRYYSGILSISIAARTHYWLYMGEKYRKIMESGKRVCLLEGWDKSFPFWYPKEKRYGFTFNDHVLASNRQTFYYPDLPFTYEEFYWTVDMPELVIKQVNMVKDRLSALPKDYVDPFKINKKSNRASFTMNHNGSLVSLPIISQWLYDWDPHTFSVGKSGNQFLNDKDAWVRTKLEEEPVRKWRKVLGLGYSYFGRLKHHNLERHNWKLLSKNWTLVLSRPYFL